MNLNVEIVDTHEKLGALQAEWNALAGDNPFLSWDWAETWWKHYQTPQTELFIPVVKDAAGHIVGIAPWKLRHTLSRGRVIHFIGSNEVCGDRLTILAAPERRCDVLAAIAGWLSDLRRQWDLLELTGVEQSNSAMLELGLRFEQHGHPTHLREDLNCWKLSLPQTWEAYLATISKSRRNKSRRLLKNQLDAGIARQRLVTSQTEFDLGFNILVELHQKRRNMLGEPGCFASDRYHSFHLEFANRMLAQNRLRLVWLEFQGQPAAVEYSILGGKTVYNYQSGFDPAFAEEHPGWLNLIATLRWAISEGYESFDFLRGDEAYKASFGGQPDRLVQLRIAGTHNSARLRHAAWRTQATFKRWAREGLKKASEFHRGTASPSSEELSPAPAYEND